MLRLHADSPQALGDRAAKAAAAVVNQAQVLARFPPALQSDIADLKNAAPADRVKYAYTIKTSMLSGGYGPKIQLRAEAFEASATGAAGLRQELRRVMNSENPGAGLQVIAGQFINHPKLLAKLPSNLQSDLLALKDAAPADLDAQANKIKATALDGGYGARVQKAAETLQKKPATASAK